MKVAFDLRRADLGSPWKIDDFDPFFFQKVELPFPVISDHEGVDRIFDYVGFLLLPAVFGYYEVDIANCLEQHLALFIGEIALLLFLLPVEFVGRERDHEIIAMLLGSSEQVDVTVMQQVECSIGNNAFHASLDSIMLREIITLCRLSEGLLGVLILLAS